MFDYFGILIWRLKYCKIQYLSGEPAFGRDRYRYRDHDPYPDRDHYHELDFDLYRYNYHRCVLEH